LLSLHGLTLHEILGQHRRSYPARTATVCGGGRWTWPELDERVARLASALEGEGVGPGDRVLWLGQNCHRVLEGTLAASRLGAVFCPVNWRQTAAELAFVVDDADPKVILWQEEEIGDATRSARDLASAGGRWIRHDDDGPDGYEAFLAGADPMPEDAVEVDPAAAVMMIYTAAFGGRPNGALLSHRAVIAQSMVIASVQHITSDYTFLNSGPLFHLGTLWSTLTTFHMAGTNVFVRRVEAEELCRLVAEERCNGAFILPPTWAQIDEVNAGGRYDLSSLKANDDAPWFKNAGGTGQTEVMGMVTFNCIGGTAQGAHGRPSPMAQVRIHDEEGHELAPGEVGEIVVRGPVVMNGYHNRPELNAERQRGGWHHTNDLGRIEGDGSITFIGPKGRMLKSAAENIYPAEVEACIRAHPAVREAAIIGVPDERWVQSVKAIVVLEDGATATADDIIEHCRASIASYKKPRTVEFVDALPRNGFFVDYDALDKRFGGGGYPGGRTRSA
jgi:acyl-CoA synthetase (AMP-forming)/AMP-acid ligase II